MLVKKDKLKGDVKGRIEMERGSEFKLSTSSSEVNLKMKQTLIKRIAAFFKRLTGLLLFSSSLLLGLLFTAIAVTIIFAFIFEGGFFN